MRPTPKFPSEQVWVEAPDFSPLGSWVAARGLASRGYTTREKQIILQDVGAGAGAAGRSSRKSGLVCSRESRQKCTLGVGGLPREMTTPYRVTEKRQSPSPTRLSDHPRGEAGGPQPKRWAGRWLRQKPAAPSRPSCSGPTSSRRGPVLSASSSGGCPQILLYPPAAPGSTANGDPTAATSAASVTSFPSKQFQFGVRATCPLAADLQTSRKKVTALVLGTRPHGPVASGREAGSLRGPPGSLVLSRAGPVLARPSLRGDGAVLRGKANVLAPSFSVTQVKRELVLQA